MGLTWRDAVSTLALVAIMIVYSSFLQGTSLWLVSSAWATSTVVLVLGLGCAVSATGNLYTTPQPNSGEIVRRITAGIGIFGAIAGLAGLVSGSAYALKLLVMAMIALWGTATAWHAFTIGADK
jgi:hypothetical protein